MNHPLLSSIISFLVLSSILFSNLSINVFLSNPIGISSIISIVTVFELCLFGYFKKLFFGQNKPALWATGITGILH